MGQQESTNNKTTGIESSLQGLNSLQSNRHFHKQKSTEKREERIHFQGILRLQDVPFKNCLQIQTQNSQSLFLENAEMTLKQLLDTRLNTTKLFPLEDIQRLIESVVYTLAYLQSRRITYKDVNTENIFYDNGAFKLLPNELIEFSTYEKLLTHFQKHNSINQTEEKSEDEESTSKEFICASPQLIIALRCKQKQVIDEQILQKSNVFCLGMQLLEVTTLLPSSLCYDSDNYDILDTLVSERIMLVQEFYNQKIARIIANMLDYDYSERMGMKELSIWVNREINDKTDLTTSQLASKEQDQSSNKKQPAKNLTKSRMINSRTDKSLSKVSTKQSKIDLTANGSQQKSKSNSIYLSKVNDNNLSRNLSKEDKNKIYLNQCRNQIEIMSSQLKKDSSESEYSRHGLDRIQYMNQALNNYGDSENYKINEYRDNQKKMYFEDDRASQKRGAKQTPIEKQRTTATKRLPYTNEDYKFDHSLRNKEQNRDQNFSNAQDFTEQRPYKNSDNYRKDKSPLKESNKYYPSVDELFKSKQQGKISSHPYTHSANSGEQNQPTAKFRKNEPEYVKTKNDRQPNARPGLGTNFIQNQDQGDHSISKIKEQIEKSRKLIEQFRKSEGIKY